MSMSIEDQELAEYLDRISFTDDKDKDWKDMPELGLDPDDDVEEKDEEDEEEDEEEEDEEDEDDDLIVDEEEKETETVKK